MPAWISLLKASLPYVTQVVTSAIPVFTSKSETSKVDPLIAKQIEELQSAATSNAESIHVLAERLQQTIVGIDNAAADVQRQLALCRYLMLFSMVLSVAALGVAIWAGLN